MRKRIVRSEWMLAVLCAVLATGCIAAPTVEHRYLQQRVTYNTVAGALLEASQLGLVSLETMREVRPYQLATSAALDAMGQAVESGNEDAAVVLAGQIDVFLATLARYLPVEE